MMTDSHFHTASNPPPATEAYHLIQQVYVLIDDHDRQVLGRFGLNITQYRLLKMLSESDGHRLTTMSARLLVAKSTITRVVDQLEAINWVRRVADKKDRRAQRVVLTPIGAEMCSRIEQDHRESLEQLFSGFSGAELQELNLLLDRLRSRLYEFFRSR